MAEYAEFAPFVAVLVICADNLERRLRQAGPSDILKYVYARALRQIVMEAVI